MNTDNTASGLIDDAERVILEAAANILGTLATKRVWEMAYARQRDDTELDTPVSYLMSCGGVRERANAASDAVRTFLIAADANASNYAPEPPAELEPIEAGSEPA